jgi:hypothetical protein
MALKRAARAGQARGASVACTRFRQLNFGNSRQRTGMMARVRRYGRGLVSAALLLCAAARAQQPTSAPTSAPADAPPAATSQPVAPAGPPLTLLDLRRMALELGFEGAYDERAVDFDFQGPFRQRERQVDRSRSFEETLGLSSAGSLFGPNVAPFDAMVRWGLTQDWSSEVVRPGWERAERPHGDLLEYDLNLSWFPRGQVSGTTFASQLHDRIPRAFLPSLDRTRERYGAGLFINDAKLPMRFSFEHVYDELTSRTHDLRDDERRGDDTFRYEATYQIAKNHAVTLNYEYNDLAEVYSGTRTRFDTTRNYLTLNHVLRFGPDGRSSWENLLRYQDESGELARDVAEFSSRVRFQHTRQLATNFATQLLRDTFHELSTTTWRGEGGVTWQPLEALTTSAQLYGFQQQNDENADFAELGTLLNATYAQENALGRFTANASYNHISTDTRDGTRHGIVIAESVTLRDPLLAYLAQPDVEWGSIVVTDSARRRTYLPMRDYVTIRVGRFTALRRIPTGNIADRDTVLVSYTYKVADDYDIQRDRFDVRLQQDFKNGLAAYYAGSLQDESIDRQRFLTYRDRNINRHRVGFTYRQNRWSTGLEYEYNDDSIDPYQAVHGNGDLVLLQNSRQQLDGKLNTSYFAFRGAEELDAHDTLLLDVGGAYRYFLMRNVEASASALYRFEDDTDAGTTDGVDLTGTLDWRLGYFTLRFEAEYKLLSLPESQDNSFAFWVKLKREIPILSKEPAR